MRYLSLVHEGSPERGRGYIWLKGFVKQVEATQARSERKAIKLANREKNPM